jgi:hypothetical protein
MDAVQPAKKTERILARSHLHEDGSVVKSGVALADRVLEALKGGVSVEVSFEGVKGASSSYFNVFLGRIEEECGLADLDRYVTLEFDSELQRTVYVRSLKSVSKGIRRPPKRPDPRSSPEGEAGPRSVWKRILDLLPSW